MELKFEQKQFKLFECGHESLVNGLVMQCRQKTDTLVEIPQGFHYFNNNLSKDSAMISSTMSICDSHKTKLINQFKELLEN